MARDWLKTILASILLGIDVLTIIARQLQGLLSKNMTFSINLMRRGKRKKIRKALSLLMMGHNNKKKASNKIVTKMINNNNSPFLQSQK